MLSFGFSSQDEDRTVRLDKDRIVLGSVVSADVRLTGEGIAPIHAVIESGPQVTIYDLASDTGLYVNGAKVVTQVLKSGDQIRIGNYEISFGINLPPSGAMPTQRFQESPSEPGRKLYIDAKEDLPALMLEDSADIEPIFDYRPTSKQALEVVMSWGRIGGSAGSGTILDVEHFVDENEVTLGTGKKGQKSSFGIPPLLQSDHHVLASRVGDRFVIHLDPGMKGVIQHQGTMQNIAGESASRQLTLQKDDFAKLSVGDIDFYLSYTAAPPTLKRGRVFERDPFFYKVMGASLALTAVTIAALLSAHVTPTLEPEQVPERIATILYQPEKYGAKREQYKETAEKAANPEEVKAKTPPPPEHVKLDIKPNMDNANKPIPKEMDVGKTQGKVAQKASKGGGSAHAENEAKEGRGARAKGNEGSRGSKHAKTGATHQDMAMRPSPNGGTGRGSGDSQVQGEGNVDILKGASSKIQDLLGNSAAHLGKGGERLKGFGGFTTLGNGGLALSGSGRGGGGDAASLGGLSDKGRGGGRVGTGMGAAGNGSGIVGGKSRVVIRSGGPEEAVVMGAIDAGAVEAALLAHRDEFRLCYEREINAEHPGLAGRVGTSFVIGSSGRVTEAGILSTTLHNSNTERCVIQVLKRIDFPVPRGGGTVEVTYPFKFNPVGG